MLTIVLSSPTVVGGQRLGMYLWQTTQHLRDHYRYLS